MSLVIILAWIFHALATSPYPWLWLLGIYFVLGGMGRQAK